MARQRLDVAELRRRGTTGDYAVHGDPAAAQCVAVFSFGFRDDGTHEAPGVSNTALARFAQDNYPALPKLMQWEIADAYPDDGTVVLRIRHDRLEEKRYLNTLEVAEQMVEFARGRGWRTAIVLAHPYHLPRADAVCAKLGLSTVAPDGLHGIPFDPQSAQEWTRGPELWAAKEAAVIDQYYADGWI